LFAMGLAILVTLNVLRGETSLDTYRPSRQRQNSDKPYNTLVCIPGQGAVAQNGLQTDFLPVSNVYHVFPGERLYDLGWFRNLKQLVSQPLFHDKTVWQSGIYSWPKLNPSILSRIRREASAQRRGDTVTAAYQ